MADTSLLAEAEDYFHDECGVFGIFGRLDAAAIVTLGLHALQHRGQEAAGIVSFDGSQFHVERHVGLIGDTFTKPAVIDRLKGTRAIGHTRYATTGGSSASICNPNLAEAITDILVGAAGAASRSPLLRTPVSGSLVVDVEGERPGRSRENGFDYEAASNTVLFFGAARPPEGTPVDIAYAFFRDIEG